MSATAFQTTVIELSVTGFPRGQCRALYRYELLTSLFPPMPAAISTPTPATYLLPLFVVYCQSQKFVSLGNWFYLHDDINDDRQHNSASGAPLCFHGTHSEGSGVRINHSRLSVRYPVTFSYFVSGHYQLSYFCLKHNVSETGFCFFLQVRPTQLGQIEKFW